VEAGRGLGVAARRRGAVIALAREQRGLAARATPGSQGKPSNRLLLLDLNNPDYKVFVELNILLLIDPSS
jgi:hypothetical protein